MFGSWASKVISGAFRMPNEDVAEASGSEMTDIAAVRLPRMFDRIQKLVDWGIAKYIRAKRLLLVRASVLAIARSRASIYRYSCLSCSTL
jgi:hypothetical protein